MEEAGIATWKILKYSNTLIECNLEDIFVYLNTLNATWKILKYSNTLNATLKILKYSNTLN